jgi:hypothetical protein
MGSLIAVEYWLIIIIHFWVLYKTKVRNKHTGHCIQIMLTHSDYLPDPGPRIRPSPKSVHPADQDKAFA